MSPGPTFERVYLALKQQLTSGLFAPGDHLEPATLGEELAASITPIRDALHRLIGERMVEAPRKDGFRVPFPTEAELRHLYGWNRDLLELGLRSRTTSIGGAGEAGPAEAPADLPSATANLFRLIARRAGNPELVAAVDNLSDRLGALRVVESELIADAAGEFLMLETALSAGDIPTLRRCLALYHRRRQRGAPEILAAAHRRGRAR